MSETGKNGMLCSEPSNYPYIKHPRGPLLKIAGMKPALFLGGIFPPPSPFTLMLVGQNRSRARFATYANESLTMKLIERDVVRLYVIPYLSQ